MATLENQRIQLSKSFAAGAAPLSIAFTPGGDDRIRTGDPLLAKQVLSQLSYIPLSYISKAPFWWAFLGSNQGPRAYQARALAT